MVFGVVPLSRGDSVRTGIFFVGVNETDGDCDIDGIFEMDGDKEMDGTIDMDGPRETDGEIDGTVTSSTNGGSFVSSDFVPNITPTTMPAIMTNNKIITMIIRRHFLLCDFLSSCCCCWLLPSLVLTAGDVAYGFLSLLSSVGETSTIFSVSNVTSLFLKLSLNVRLLT